MTMQPMSAVSAAHTPMNGPREPGNDEGPPLQDLRDDVARLEKDLCFKRLIRDDYRKREEQAETHSDELFKKLKSMADKDHYLRKADKITPYFGLPSPMIIIMGASIHNPIMAVAGMVMLLGAMAVKEYAKRKIKEIDQQFSPLKSTYERAFAETQELKSKRQGYENETFKVESDYNRLKERMLQAEGEVKRMAEMLSQDRPSGASCVDDMGDYIVISGMKVQKKSA
jgi:hypothetical protein